MEVKIKIVPVGRHSARIVFENGEFSGREFELSGERSVDGKLWVMGVIELVPIEKPARKEIVGAIPKVRLRLDDAGIYFKHLNVYIRNKGPESSDIVVKTGKLQGRAFRMPITLFSHGEKSELSISAFDGDGEYYEIIKPDASTKESLKKLLADFNNGSTFAFN